MIKTSSACVVAAVALSSGAFAATYSFSNITGNSATNAAAGEAQLSLSTMALANPQLVRFTLTNAAGMASTVKNVFVDDASGILVSVNGFNATAGVSFKIGTNGSLPGGNSLAATFNENHAIGVRANNPAPSNGVNNGETLDWTYTLANGFTVADVDNALASGMLRFGVHVIAWADGGSEAFVNDPGTPNLIPSPLASLMGAAGLGLLGARRRRN
jgi:MYXO-CTERM domain-containing protein